MTTLVTGSNGFVGKALCARLQADGQHVVRAVRYIGARNAVEEFAVGNIGPDTDWRIPLTGCEAVVHCAARVHTTRDEAVDKLAAFRSVNTCGTLALAKQAAEASVKRFVFLSTVKVNGEATLIDKPFRAGDTPQPSDPYAISKFEAEQGLFKLGNETGMEIVCIRPPLVYGPEVKANFLALIHGLGYGLPVPLASIYNKRSLIGVNNLTDLIAVCLSHPAAAGEVFLASDGRDLSTPELLRLLSTALHRPARLFHFSPALLLWGASLVGRGDSMRRLTESLTVDIEHTLSTLQWQPPFSVELELEKTVANYVNN